MAEAALAGVVAAAVNKLLDEVLQQQVGDDSALRSLHTTLNDANNLGCEL